MIILAVVGEANANHSKSTEDKTIRCVQGYFTIYALSMMSCSLPVRQQNTSVSLPVLLVAPGGQFASLTIHQAGSGASLFPRVVVLY